jgi:hypothetical protein
MGISDFGLTFLLVGAVAFVLPYLDPRDNRPQSHLWRYRDNQLPELGRVAWALEATLSHRRRLFFGMGLAENSPLRGSYAERSMPQLPLQTQTQSR